MESIFNIVIVGGGAAGLFCAARLSEVAPAGLKILLCEKTDNLGHKLLLSGNGQCNFTNAIEMKEFSTKYGQHYYFLRQALYHLPNTKLIEYFKTIGIESTIRDDKKVFPASMDATEIRDRLVDSIRKYPIEIKLNSSVKKIQFHDDKTEIFTDSGSFYAKCLVLCTGGASFPETGSTGDIIGLLPDIEKKPFLPALCPPKLTNVESRLTTIAGVTLPNATISVIRNQRDILTATGSLLFTHTGLSGPVILDNSRYFEPDDVIVVYLTEHTNLSQFDRHLTNLIDQNPTRLLKNLISLLKIPESIRDLCTKPIDYLDKKCSQISSGERQLLGMFLYAMMFKIESPGDIERAMCCSGGITLTEINRKTMQLKKHPNVYIAGECIDIDGDTGGFNIHAAFATANLAVMDIVGRLK
jgi:hypothetical protein